MVFRHATPPRFQDVDAAGIVFYARIFGFFHDAYVAFLESLGPDFALHRAIDDAEFLLPLVHAEADFKAPLRFGDEAMTSVRVSRIGESAYTLSYEIRRGDGELAAQGETVHACVSRGDFKSTPLPERLRAGLMAYQGGMES